MDFLFYAYFFAHVWCIWAVIDVPYRDNAILLAGSPISHLPTSNIFAYATHFDAHPMGLEWIDDTTCVLVFQTPSAARTAFRHLTKSATELAGEADDAITAKSIPVTLWPPEERINKSLGKGEGLKGTIRMRWATTADVKKKGSGKDSQFYKKYGKDAGKEGYLDAGSGGGDSHSHKRRRGEVDNQIAKAHLDDELDAFLAKPGYSRQPSPPSKMRSDYLDKGSKTLLERTSVIRARPDTLASRLSEDISGPERETRQNAREYKGLPRGRRRGGDDGSSSHSRTERLRKTAQDLDAELDAFLNAKD